MFRFGNNTAADPSKYPLIVVADDFFGIEGFSK
jgi:hypothetical protein